MKFLNVYEGENIRPMADRFLFELCKERETENAVNISFQLPSWQEHVAFMYRRPYRYWFLLEPEQGQGKDNWIGYISATTHNEIGIVLLQRWRGMGYGKQAVGGFVRQFKPLPALSSVRPGRWLANINPDNKASIALFSGLGFGLKQHTYEL